jgi:hypothetical protein
VCVCIFECVYSSTFAATCSTLRIHQRWPRSLLTGLPCAPFPPSLGRICLCISAHRCVSGLRCALCFPARPVAQHLHLLRLAGRLICVGRHTPSVREAVHGRGSAARSRGKVFGVAVELNTLIRLPSQSNFGNTEECGVNSLDCCWGARRWWAVWTATGLPRPSAVFVITRKCD